MANLVRAMGPAVFLASNTTMSSMVIVLTDGAVDYTFSTVLPSLTANSYSPHTWVGHVAAKIRQYIFDRCAVTGAITTKPTLANIDVSLGWPQASPNNVVPGVNLSLPRLHIGAIGGALVGAAPVVIKSFQINNATNGWASLWGWCEVGETRLANAASGEVSANVLNSNCRFQPRFFYAFRAAYNDFGNEESSPGAFGDDHADGFATYYEAGEPEVTRLIELVSQQRQLTGPMFKVGVFSSFGATRNLLNLQPIDSVTSGEAVLNGMTGTYKRTDELSLGQYLRIGKSLYPVRFKSVAGNVFTCYENIPTTYSFAAGTPIYCISEAHAMILEWRRTGLLLFYEVDDSTGLTSWMADAFVPNNQGRWVIGHERKTRIPLYTVKLAGKLSLNSGLAVAA